MAIKLFNPFSPGYRLINGIHLNNLFQGNEAIQSLRLGSQAAQTDALQKVALFVNNATNTDITASVPVGAGISAIQVYTTTAFTAVTDAMISIGNAAGGAQYVAAVSIKAVGVYNLTLVNAAAAALLSMPSGSPNLFIRIAQSGGNTAVGAATLVVDYLLP